MKIGQIEKDNLKREINKLQSTNIDELKSTNIELKSTVSKHETELKIVKDDLQQALKDKKSISDRINLLRIEYDNHLSSVRKTDGNSIEDKQIIDAQSKQIKDLVEENNQFKASYEEAYNQLDSTYIAYQDLESKNKLFHSKIDNSNQRVEQLTGEVFKWSLENDKCKDEVKQKDLILTSKEQQIKLLQQKTESYVKEVDVREGLVQISKEKEKVQEVMIKQLQGEVEEVKKVVNDQKQQIEESEAILHKSMDQMSDRLYKMGVNFVKTGRITDPELADLDLGPIGEMDETKILMLEIKKYKDMVKCPTCDNHKSIKLKCKHTY